MFGHCIWLEIPFLKQYIYDYAVLNGGEIFLPHISIKTKMTRKDAFRNYSKTRKYNKSLTLGKPYIDSEQNFNIIQCDVLEYPNKHVSIAYRYDKPWTTEELQQCNPPNQIECKDYNIWHCDGVVADWYCVKKH